MDVFVSYKREDRAAVVALVSALRELGLSTWFDESLTPGEVYTDEIDRELSNAKAVLVCWSQAASESEFVFAEAYKGWSQKKLAAVNLDRRFSTASLRVPLNAVQALDLHSESNIWAHENWPKIVDRIAALAGRPQVSILCRFVSDINCNRQLATAIAGLEQWTKQHPDDAAASLARSLLEKLGPERQALQEAERRAAEKKAQERARLFEAERRRLREELEAAERREREAARQSRHEAWLASTRVARIGAIVALVVVLATSVVGFFLNRASAERRRTDAQIETLLHRDATTFSSLTIQEASRELLDQQPPVCGAPPDNGWRVPHRYRSLVQKRGLSFSNGLCPNQSGEFESRRNALYLDLGRHLWTSCRRSFDFSTLGRNRIQAACLSGAGALQGTGEYGGVLFNEAAGCSTFSPRDFDESFLIHGYYEQYRCRVTDGVEVSASTSGGDRPGAYEYFTEHVAFFRNRDDGVATAIQLFAPLVENPQDAVMRAMAAEAKRSDRNSSEEVQAESRSTDWSCSLQSNIDDQGHRWGLNLYCQWADA